MGKFERESKGARPLADPASKDYNARVSLTKNNVISLSLFVSQQILNTHPFL